MPTRLTPPQVLSLPAVRRRAAGDGIAGVAPTVLLLVGLAAAMFSGWATARGSTLLLAPLVGLALYIILAHTTLTPYAAILIGASTFASTYALPRTAHAYPAELFVILGLVLLPFSNYRRFGGGTGLLM